MQDNQPSPILRAIDISKSYGRRRALDRAQRHRDAVLAQQALAHHVAVCDPAWKIDPGRGVIGVQL